MSTSTRTVLGELVQHFVTLEPGETVDILLDSVASAAVSVQVTVGAGDTAHVHGACTDTSAVAVIEHDAFPLFGEDGAVTATGNRRTACTAFPGPLRTVFVTAAAGNTKALRVTVLQ